MTDFVIVGAGAAGLSAAYQLEQLGLTYRVLEADNTRIGGRLRKDDTSWDIPVDLGGEWIHGDPNILLNSIVNEPLPSSLETFRYLPDAMLWEGSGFMPDTYTDVDYKFRGYTWFDFISDNLAAKLSPGSIELGCKVTTIDYSGTISTVTCMDGSTFQAGKVIVTISIKLLQQGTIDFVPDLPSSHQNALAQFKMEPALKIFIEFTSQFYPDFFTVDQDYVTFSSEMESSDYFERIFYDETLGQTSNNNILGLFVYGRTCDQYLAAGNEQAAVNLVLAELDGIFGGSTATDAYVEHVIQLWPNEANVMTGYTRWVEEDPDPIRVLQQAIDDKLVFAGEALPVDGENWGFAHGAALSGKLAVQVLSGTQPSESSCFSAETTVMVEGKGWTGISSLQVGDYVLSSNGRFSLVYSLGHVNHEINAKFLQLYSEHEMVHYNSEPLEVTVDHLVFVLQENGQVAALPAKDVVVGDKVATLQGPNSYGTVTKIKSVHRQGVYAPFTMSGDIVVNGGLVASNYAAVFEGIVHSQSLYHAALAPVRLLCMLNFEWCRQETHSSAGISQWVSGYMWVLKQGTVVRFISALIIAPLIGVFAGLERLLLCSYSYLGAILVTIMMLGLAAAGSGKMSQKRLSAASNKFL